MGILICAGEKIFNSNAMAANMFCFDCVFLSGLISIMRASPAPLKLASVSRTICFPGMGCSNANSNESFFLLFIESKVSVSSNMTLIAVFALSTF